MTIARHGTEGWALARRSGGSRNSPKSDCIRRNVWTPPRHASATRASKRLSIGCAAETTPFASCCLKTYTTNATVSRGDFDFILSRIEQDEVYRL